MHRLNIPSLLYILLILSGPLSSTSATDYYFSDCATGGSGTVSDPYCLDPGNDGLAESFDYVMDGISPDVGPGDNIFLCAGACDGVGTAMYRPENHDNTSVSVFPKTDVLFDPVTDGTASQPITIQPYCTGNPLTCETVITCDCATGGSGTVSDPYCLDPGNDGLAESFDYVMDGISPDVGPGDNIFLCAGACDGVGTAMYRPENHDNTSVSVFPKTDVLFDPVTDGTASQPITIQPYCTGNPLTCETVIISGDTNANNTYDPGTDAQAIFFNVDAATCCTNPKGSGGKDHYHVFGDPDGDGTPNLIFEKARGHAFFNGEGGNGWIIDGLEIRFIGAEFFQNPLPGSGGIGDVGCNSGVFSSYAFYVGRMGGPQGPANITIRNNKIHSICHVAVRSLENCGLTGGNDCTDGQGEMLVENNEFYNMEAVANGHQGRNWTFRGNYAHDTNSGIGVEEQVFNVLIEDNTLACLGEYKLDDDFKCRKQIAIGDGDAPPSNGCGDAGTNSGSGLCTARDIIIRRNKVFGASYLNEPGNGKGYLRGGIVVTAHNSTGDLGNTVIENNMVWNIKPRFSCKLSSISGGRGDVNESPIGINTSDRVIVQNNTVYDAACWGILVGGTNHIIRNNLIVESRNQGTLSDLPELMVLADAAGSTLEYNNMHYGSQADPVLQIGETTYNCADTFPGVGNFCTATTFMNTNGPKDTWDLHLIATDIVNQDSGTSAVGGVTDDIDKQSRLGLVDVGADEIVTIPQPPTNLRIVATIPPLLPAQAFYAAPNGTSEGNGNLSNPWDLTTAFLPGKVPPGGTLLLREGDYDNVPDGSEVAGTEANPVIVRSVPGEWAVFRLHSSWRPSGEWVVYRDFEIAGESGTRISQIISSSAPNLNRTPFIPQGNHQKYINLVIHDLLANGMGTIRGDAVNIEIYGCIIYYNGWTAPNRTHGHGLYLQNGTPDNLQPLFKVAENNIIWGNAHTGIQLFGSSAVINNVWLNENVIWANGSSAITAGAGRPMQNIIITDNAIYRSNVRLGGITRRDGDLTLVNNILTGGLFAIQIQIWDTLTLQGNFIWAPVLSAYFIAPDPWDITRTLWNENSYVEGGASGVAREAQFRLADGKNRIYADWQSRTGFDTTSIYTVTPTQLPDATMIRINPNIHEEGRAHITIFNWNQHETISVDFSSFMQVGAAYEVYSAYDYLAGPLQIGVYIGTPVSLSMTSQNVATPIGTGFPISVIPSQEFGVFVVQAQR